MGPDKDEDFQKAIDFFKTYSSTHTEINNSKWEIVYEDFLKHKEPKQTATLIGIHKTLIPKGK